MSIAGAKKRGLRRWGRPPGNRTAGLKLPTEAIEDPTEKDTFGTCQGTQSRDPTKVQVTRKSGQEMLHPSRPH